MTQDMGGGEKITHAELVEIFGEEMPMEAARLIAEPWEGTSDELRAELRKFVPARLSDIKRDLVTMLEWWAWWIKPGGNGVRLEKGPGGRPPYNPEQFKMLEEAITEIKFHRAAPGQDAPNLSGKQS